MENISDALKMAGSILLFVIALSLIIPLIGQARRTADAVMDFADRQSATNGIDEEEDGGSLERNFFYMPKDDDVPMQARIVGVNDILPTVLRAFDEDFKVVFVIDKLDNRDVKKASPINMYLWVGGQQSENKSDIDRRPINTIELQNTSVADGDGSKEGFLNGILYGDYSFAQQSSISGSNQKEKFQNKFNVRLGDYGETSDKYYPAIPSSSGKYGLVGYLEDYIGQINPTKNYVIEEYLGVYYKADVDVAAEGNDILLSDYQKIPESMKNDRRVVTYFLTTKPKT